MIKNVSAGLLLLFAISSCSKKIQPNKTTTTTETISGKDTVTVTTREKTDTMLVKKPVVKKKPGTAVPKVIVVNDQYAKKSVDGRLYYDLQGHRYWRSKKDGKYYLFNKSMLTDDAFRAPK